MWQVAVAAAVAGSGLLAKHLFPPNTQQNVPQKDPFPLTSNNDSSHLPDHISEDQRNEQNGGGLFRFSSSGSRSKHKTFRVVSNKNKKNKKKDVGWFDNAACSDHHHHRKSSSSGGGKRVLVFLKRRKICRVSSGNGKLHPSCSKDCSSFGWGLGMGIMYMMSAGKADVSKLSSAIDETAKVVHELKSELSNQKSSHGQQLLESVGDPTKAMYAKQEQANIGSCTLNSKHPLSTKDINHLAESEYASSVLTDEQQPEGAEMDQLEAELESELQKLPWSITETSAQDGSLNELPQIQRCEPMNQSSASYQSNGVSPADLNRKLSHLLVQQQESHISELESELHLAYSKLQEKEAELRALKDCVKRLTEFSISTVSDEETETCGEQEQNLELGYEENRGASDAMVGMKRSIASQMRS